MRQCWIDLCFVYVYVSVLLLLLSPLGEDDGRKEDVEEEDDDGCKHFFCDPLCLLPGVWQSRVVCGAALICPFPFRLFV